MKNCKIDLFSCLIACALVYFLWHLTRVLG